MCVRGGGGEKGGEGKVSISSNYHTYPVLDRQVSEQLIPRSDAVF